MARRPSRSASRSSRSSSGTARALFAISTLLSLGLVAAAVVLAQTMNLAACPLCIWQRIFYLAVAAFGLLGIVAAGSRGLRRTLALLTALAAAAGAFVAGYQSYIQRFAAEAPCGVARWWERVVDALGERSPLLFGASGLCRDPGWKFLELSLAEWSLAGFFLLFFGAVYLFADRRR